MQNSAVEDGAQPIMDVIEQSRANPFCESESRAARDPHFELVTRNLERYRWYGPILDRAEERNLIGRAQAGDAVALDRLIRSHARTVLKLAGKYHGSTRDDLAAAGFIGLIEAINRFDLSSPYRLRTYADPWIRKFIGEQAMGKFRPIAPQTIAACKAAKYQEHYSTTDSYADDGDGTKGWDYGSDAPDRHQNPVPVELPANLGVISQWSRNSVRAPWNGRWWRISRSKRVYAPLQDGWAAEMADRRRLLQIGRQKYADELVARDNARPKSDYFFALARQGRAELRSNLPPPQPRHLQTENPCLTQHTNQLAVTRWQKRCSPLQPELPKPAGENSQSELSTI